MLFSGERRERRNAARSQEARECMAKILDKPDLPIAPMGTEVVIEEESSVTFHRVSFIHPENHQVTYKFVDPQYDERFNPAWAPEAPPVIEEAELDVVASLRQAVRPPARRLDEIFKFMDGQLGAL